MLSDLYLGEREKESILPTTAGIVLISFWHQFDINPWKYIRGEGGSFFKWKLKAIGSLPVNFNNAFRLNGCKKKRRELEALPALEHLNNLFKRFLSASHLNWHKWFGKSEKDVFLERLTFLNVKKRCRIYNPLKASIHFCSFQTRKKRYQPSSIKVLILTLSLGKRGGGNLKMGISIPKKVFFCVSETQQSDFDPAEISHTPKVATRCPQFTVKDLVATAHAQQKSKWTTLMALLFIYVSVFGVFFERKWEGSAISRSASFPLLCE